LAFFAFLLIYVSPIKYYSMVDMEYADQEIGVPGKSKNPSSVPIRVIRG